MTTETKATEDRPEVQISKILVSVDGSEYSLNAAKYADLKDKVEYWFDKVRQLAKNAGLTDVKTEALVEANRF